jgi:hypothetical protein
MENFKKFRNTKYSIGDNGTVISEHEWRGTCSRVLKPHLVKGYYAIELVEENIRSFHKVHRLVAEIFVPNPNNFTIVNHKDFNRLNNHYSNLEWMSLSNNVKDAWHNDRMSIGSTRTTSKLDETAVEKIKLLFVENVLDNQQIADAFEVARSTISQIRRLDTWTHVRPDLKFQNTSPRGVGGTKKLCGEDIPIIRQMYEEGKTLRAIGKIFGVNYGTINGIISGRNWKNY